MFSYPMEKYRFYCSKNKVIAVSTYAGRVVRGVAKCDPKDNFDVEAGKKLAAARCGAKVAAKRLARANAQLNKAVDALNDAYSYYNKMSDYFNDAVEADYQAMNDLEDLVSKM